jgi:F0F1-type ATP synthase membrane subunit b/b'
MSENDDTDLSAEESISDEISERVRSVISAAESAATAIRHEAEQQAQIKRRAAEGERQRFIEQAKAEAEALLEERMKRISELSDALIEGAEQILMRMEGAQDVKRQLDTMVQALATAAEELAAESGLVREVPRPRPVAVEDEPPAAEQPRMRAVPEPEETASVTELRVPQKAEPEPEVAEPLPEAEPEVTEGDAAAASDNGPATKADVTPVEVVPAEESSDDEDVEVVDAVAVEDEPESEPARRNGAPAAEKQAPEPRGFDGDDMLAARLVALQMAVAGSARDEVEAHLRKTFELDEPGTILNDVFGTESKL